MISLENFIKKCQIDLMSERKISEQTILLVGKLSKREQVLIKPVFEFIVKNEIEITTNDYDFSSSERILVCRLIPLFFSLDTDDPRWSSYLLTQSVSAMVQIKGIKLYEIGIAFIEVMIDFGTPLSRSVYNFCLDFSREFVIP